MYTSLISACATFSELRSKEVINVRDGSALGCICDIEINLYSGAISSIILPGNGLLASLTSKNRIVIPWCNIERIGRDTILVKHEIIQSDNA